MYKMKFSCMGCVFSEMEVHSEGSRQTGCEIGRLEKLGFDDKQVETDENGNHYALFDRFCNAYRPEEWASQVKPEDRQKTIMREVSPSVGFFIIFDNTIEKPLDKLQETLLSIKNQEGDHQARYVVVLNDKIEYNPEIHEMLELLFEGRQTKGHLPTEYNIVLTLKGFDSSFEIIDEAFTKAKNGWIYTTQSTFPVQKNLLQKIHERININMRRLVVVEPKDEALNGMIFQAAAFKFIKGSKPILDEETLLLDSKNFIERIKDMDTDDPDTVVTWEQFQND